MLKSAMERMGLSARGGTRILKMARTIADLAGADTIGRVHMLEALGLRLSDPSSPV